MSRILIVVFWPAPEPGGLAARAIAGTVSAATATNRMRARRSGLRPATDGITGTWISSSRGADRMTGRGAEFYRSLPDLTNEHLGAKRRLCRSCRRFWCRWATLDQGNGDVDQAARWPEEGTGKPSMSRR